MITTKQPIPANLLGKTNKNTNYIPLFPNLIEGQIDENVPVIHEKDELSSFPTEDRVDIDNRAVINRDMDRYEP